MSVDWRNVNLWPARVGSPSVGKEPPPGGVSKRMMVTISNGASLTSITWTKYVWDTEFGFGY